MLCRSLATNAPFSMIRVNQQTLLSNPGPDSVIEIALYQPDIPQNTGTILRLAACLGLDVHIIEPAGFQWSLKSFRRAGMDYIDQVTVHRHDSFERFMADMAGRRLILASTRASGSYTNFKFQAGDVVVFGRESAGVPDKVHEQISQQITIPIRAEARSLNIAVSVAMIAGEAVRQLSAG